jgi:hypothetical protein
MEKNPFYIDYTGKKNRRGGARTIASKDQYLKLPSRIDQHL